MKKIFSFLSIFILLFSRSSKAQTDGDAFFAMPSVHEIQFTFTQPGYWDSLVAYMPAEQYMKTTISIDGTVFPDVGVKFKGNSSYSNPSDKKPFKVDMNEFVSGQDIDGLKKFNLNNGFKDPSFMREKITLDFCNEHGIAAPRCAYAKLYINGAYWGLYTFVEEVDKTFLDDDDRFGNKQGNLFKGDPSGDLKYLGSSLAPYYTKYELHTNETENDWSDLYNFIDNINNSGTYFYDSLEAVFNTHSFIKSWAALNLFSNLDSYIGSGHNYFVYHDTVSDKFEWITWDVNESFGNFNMGMTASQMKNLSMFFVSSPSASRPLVQNMLANTTYRNELVATFCDWLSTGFTNAVIDPKVDSLADAIRADVYADTKKFFTNSDFDANLTSDLTGGSPGSSTAIGIKSFITERRAALLAELALNGCNVGIAENTVAINPMSLYPNPASDKLTISFNNDLEKNTVQIYNTLGEQVVAVVSAAASETVPVAGLANGLYIVRLNGNISGRFQVLK